ncbi:MAG: glycosyltransferase family 4 protein [Brumimicrobium sp.]
MIKVFHFSNKPAFPLRDGGCIAISSILKSLLNSDEVKTYHYTLSTYKHPFEVEAYPVSWLQNMNINSGKVNTDTNPFTALYYLIKNKSYNVARFYDKKVEKEIKSILEKEHFDIALIESIFLLPYLYLFRAKNIKIVVRAHNIEHKVWESIAKNAKNPIKKWYLKKLSKQLKDFEVKNLSRVDGIISITEEDALFFHQFEPKIITTSIPPIFQPKEKDANYHLDDFYFLGAMDWKPNIEGIDWFLNEVIPEGLKGSEFYLAGKSLEKRKIKKKGIKTVGEVENALKFINEHGICVIPLLSGGGLKIKLLENMALGKPIVTTIEGVRGVGVQHEKEVLIANNPDEFREQMYRLHLDFDLRKRLGQQAKQFIINNYSEEKLTRRLIGFLKDI